MRYVAYFVSEGPNKDRKAVTKCKVRDHKVMCETIYECNLMFDFPVRKPPLFISLWKNFRWVFLNALIRFFLCRKQDGHEIIPG
ncbi:hypothetical protein CEXT_741241 [Caerostris extrusa]|uniref:Uncharacterized protein n=1 Tax=Caerostris extrusa TaxID=172846 RepID=A0AAV4P5H4_CAEEX|nr:hypothetical protein CEXT_741241 [Caerostris extrusa]